MEWVLNNLPLILCFIFGIVFLILEAIIPGVGLAGLIGLALSIVAIVLTGISYGPLATLGISIVIFVVVAIVFSITLKSLRDGKLGKRYVLRSDLNDTEGFVANQPRQDLVGKIGFTTSDLRPSGIAEIEGERLDVVSRGAFIAKDEHIKVVQVEDFNIIVERL